MELGISAEVTKDVIQEVTVNEFDLLKEYEIEELQVNIEKSLLRNRLNTFEEIDYKPTEQDILDKNNKYLFECIKSAEENPEIRRAVLNNMENNCKLKGDTGEYFASKKLNRLGEFKRSVPHEIGGRTNIIDFVCREGLKKNESFQALKVSENGIDIITERIYLPKEKSLAVEIKNGLSEINNRKHLKEQLEAGKSLCQKSFLGINKGMASEMISNPEKYIKAINDIKTQADEIVVLMPDVETQIVKIGGLDLRGYNIY